MTSEHTTKGMAWIPEGEFLMGSEDFYPEERPVHRVAVDGFWMDEHPVTVAEFRRFVKATGYITWAEQAPDPADYPGAEPELLVPGSIVFTGSKGPVDLTDSPNWWSWIPGAQWRYPEGPGSTLHGRERHPVTHVAHRDACAYAAWAEKELPTEAEWERAARGRLESKTFTWGDEFAPKGKLMANTWQGEFPLGEHLARPLRTHVTRRDLSTERLWPLRHGGQCLGVDRRLLHPGPRRCDRPALLHPRNPRTTSPDRSYGQDGVGDDIPRRVTKGGSHLCAPNYCLRYRPAARQGEPIDSTTSHIGFRCIVRNQ